ncbi:MAG: acetyl-CoA carboxylase, carboxyltransferase subunit beta [Lachnospiraceae bacterium]|nr:acetyl-CoA carboxylase, carboxyltransferase subunit beta [Lachnospiraceae bacterium]
MSSLFPKKQKQKHKRSNEHLPIPESLWNKCNKCPNIILVEDLNISKMVCPKCNYHYKLAPSQRIMYTFDAGSFVETEAELIGSNPLDFPDYEKKIDEARESTESNEAIITGIASIDNMQCITVVMNGYFMMGSMGYAVGEKFTRACELAIEKRLPLIAFTVSGGARMQEGVVSLMQMAKVSAAIRHLNETGLLYVVVLTNPTTGGVTASLAMLGDITLAEPGALIGFAGPRIISQTIKQTLPDGFQSSEFLKEHGFVDAIVNRRDIRKTLAAILSIHGANPLVAL